MKMKTNSTSPFLSSILPPPCSDVPFMPDVTFGGLLGELFHAIAFSHPFLERTFSSISRRLGVEKYILNQVFLSFLNKFCSP